jgi:hypothetical protein
MKANEFAKECADAMGFKGRLMLFAAGFLGLFFPGTVIYSLLIGVARGLKDADIAKILEELQ